HVATADADALGGVVDGEGQRVVWRLGCGLSSHGIAPRSQVLAPETKTGPAQAGAAVLRACHQPRASGASILRSGVWASPCFALLAAWMRPASTGLGAHPLRASASGS